MHEIICPAFHMYVLYVALDPLNGYMRGQRKQLESRTGMSGYRSRLTVTEAERPLGASGFRVRAASESTT